LQADNGKGENLKALIIIYMTNDFVFETYEYEGETYQGKLVAPLGKTIIDKTAGLIKKTVSGGTVSVFRLTKDHLNAFANPELELKVAELGINEVFITGLVEEICIERGFRTNIVEGCTAPFEDEKGKEALKELQPAGQNWLMTFPTT
jgi:nicotinamidase-related amidase